MTLLAPDVRHYVGAHIRSGSCAEWTLRSCATHTAAMKLQLPKAPVDPLGEALQLLRMNAILFSRCHFTAPWGLALPALQGMLMFHVVTAGSCLIEVEGSEPRLLKRGDFALVPRGAGHVLLSAPRAKTVPLFDMPRETISERYEILRRDGGGTATELLCGTMQFDHPGADQLLKLLPAMIASAAAKSPHSEWLQGTLQLMADEAGERKPGREALLAKLADAVVVHAVRGWIENDPAARTGWLNALRDKQIGRAIALIHRDPAHSWTLASLAEEVAMSRSAFATRFAELVGLPVMQYLTQWRMQMALRLLKDGDVSIAELANQLGYQSEAAFSRAFKRFAGVSPGSVRRTPDPAIT